MEWFSEVMDLWKQVSVHISGVSNQMFQVWPDRFSYESISYIFKVLYLKKTSMGLIPEENFNGLGLWYFSSTYSTIPRPEFEKEWLKPIQYF